MIPPKLGGGVENTGKAPGQKHNYQENYRLMYLGYYTKSTGRKPTDGGKSVTRLVMFSH